MTSCREALAILRQFGLNRLDGERDGIPFEKVCP